MMSSPAEAVSPSPGSAEVSSSSDGDARIRQLKQELIHLQKSQDFEAWKNARMHQAVIIVSLIASLAATVMAQVVTTKWIVSLVAAIPAFGVALSQQLRCVEAANLNRRRAQLASSLLVKLRYELPTEKIDGAVAKIAEEFRTESEKLNLMWEQLPDPSNNKPT